MKVAISFFIWPLGTVAFGMEQVGIRATHEQVLLFLLSPRPQVTPKQSQTQAGNGPTTPPLASLHEFTGHAPTCEYEMQYQPEVEVAMHEWVAKSQSNPGQQVVELPSA